MWKHTARSLPLGALFVATTVMTTLPAIAQAVSCEGVGIVTIAPQHPSSADAVRYGVTLPVDPLGSSKPFRVWTANSVSLAQNLDYNINIEVYIADESVFFPGAPPASPYPHTMMIGSIPPLAAGNYTPRAAVTVYNADRRNFEQVCPLTNSTTVTVSTQSGSTTSSPVVEFYNQTLDHYFITQSVAEITSLDSGGVWRRTGESFVMYVPSGSDGRGQAVFRYYGLPTSGLDSHFFTWSLLERDALDAGVLRSDWVKETGNAFEAVVPHPETGSCPFGAVPVYRLWNARPDSAHRYTVSTTIRDEMIARGYIIEGFGGGSYPVAMCALTQ